MPSSRSFDLTVARLTDNSSITFAGIDKDEYKNLSAYLKDKGIKMRSVDVETNQHIEMSDDDGAEDEEESEQPHKGSKKAAPAGKKPQAAAMDEDDSDEDDESFNEEGSGGSEDEDGEDDDDEEGEKEDDSDGDAHMDEGIDKDELKALQKENAGIDLSGTRRTRGNARAAAQQKK